MPFNIGKSGAHVTEVGQFVSIGVVSAEQKPPDGAGKAALSGCW